VSDPIVGIDLGTSNTVVAACDETGNPQVLADDNGYKIHPSVVSFHPNGAVVVGAEAKQRKVIDPRNTVYSVKRLIGRPFKAREIATAAARMPYVIKEGVNQQPVIATRAGEFAIPEVSAIVLDHARNVARRALATEVQRAVITVPANFNEAQRSATATAGAIAGLTVVRVLNEPTAAALAYGHARQLNRLIAVYDFGGGTFDVTVLRLDHQVYEVLGTAGDSFLGGDDIDERLVDHMVAAFLAEHRIDLRENELALMRLRAVAEQIKIELSRRQKAIVKIDEIAYGPGGAPVDLELTVTREELVAKIGDIVDRTFAVCADALKTSGAGLKDIEDVVLVGGSTKIPHVRERVAQFFERTVRTDVNPEEAVALGASLQAAALQRTLSGKRPTAKQSAPPPAPPLEQRPTGDIPTVGGARSTAPRVATSDIIELDPDVTTDAGTGTFGGVTTETPTEVKKEPRRQTNPLGVPVRAGRPDTIRPVTRGASIDVFEGGGTNPGTNPGTGPGTNPGTDPGMKPLGRISRPMATVVVPPLPTSTPTPPPPVAKTMLGVPAAPAAPPRREGFEDETTAARGAAAQPTLIAPAVAPPTAPTTAQMPAMPAPTIVDVTPRSLGIGTVAGYCEELIRRNSRVPTESKRLFTTSHDKQKLVRISVCQGESRRLDENVVLGDLVLDNLEPRPRGETTIEVTFVLNASGILEVSARDARTGREQHASLDIVGAQSAQEVIEARARLRALRR